MELFVLQQNIDRYQRLLGEEIDETRRRMLARLLVAAEREFAMTSSAAEGVGNAGKLRAPPLSEGTRRYLERFRLELVLSGTPYLLLDPGPGLRILDASEAYAAVTMTTRDGLAGQHLFEVFPDNPDVDAADGVANLYASLRTAAETRRPHRMAIQRYDVRNQAGEFVERHWQPINTPIFDDDERLVALLHHVEDVTAEVRRSTVP